MTHEIKAVCNPRKNEYMYVRSFLNTSTLSKSSTLVSTHVLNLSKYGTYPTTNTSYVRLSIRRKFLIPSSTLACCHRDDSWP